MSAFETLPEAAPQQKAISPSGIAELAGASYEGAQQWDAGTLHYFREPVTGTSLAVWESQLTVAVLQASINSARYRFGVA